jgi:hypothetical protein
MNGVIGSQTSSNDWGAPLPFMLHQNIQDAHTPVTSEAARDQLFIGDLERQMAQFEKDYQATLPEVRKRYVLPTDSSVFEFLNDHRGIPQLLIDAFPHLQKYFENTVFALRATCDEYGWENLYVDVLWPSDAGDAIRLLDEFEDEWWLANCRTARGALTFTYRLV